MFCFLSSARLAATAAAATAIVFTNNTPFAVQAQSQDATDVDWRTLTFKNDQDTLTDFSYAGTYASSESLPSAYDAPTITLDATDESTDMTPQIQAALDQLSEAGGGILELSAGVFNISSASIILSGVGVTLRGQLPKDTGLASETVVRVSGPGRTPFVIGQENAESIVYRNGTQTHITTDYVGAGHTTFDVADASHFEAGDYVEIQRTVSQEWIEAEGMDDLERNGKKQTWISPGTVYAQRRQIAAISNQTLQLDYGLTDPLNATIEDPATILRYDLPHTFTRSCSVESLNIQLVDDESGSPINDVQFQNALVFMPWSRDNWARQLSLSGFISGVHVQRDASRVTLQDINVWRSTKTDTSSGYPADFLVDGSQILLHRCSTAGVEDSDSFTIATGSLVAGPIVALQHATSDVRHMVEPHARWATGVLFDNSLVGTLSLINRGVYGSGQGWACAFSVAWNVVSFGSMAVQNPPQSANLCVGCMGQIEEEDADPESYVSPQQQATPESLFMAQLAGRFGANTANTILLDPATQANKPGSSSSAASPSSPSSTSSATASSSTSRSSSSSSSSSSTRSTSSTSSHRPTSSSSSDSSSSSRTRSTASASETADEEDLQDLRPRLLATSSAQSLTHHFATLLLSLAILQLVNIRLP